MINKIFSSGSKNNKSDFYVEYAPNDSNKISIDINSKNNFLFGSKINDLCLQVCKDLNIVGGNFLINDTGGQYFTLQARIEATVKSAWPNIKSESLPEFKKHSNYKSKKDRFRRSRLYIPGNQAKLMLNAGIHKPDGIILDLEDSVSQSGRSLEVQASCGLPHLLLSNQGRRLHRARLDLHRHPPAARQQSDLRLALARAEGLLLQDEGRLLPLPRRVHDRRRAGGRVLQGREGVRAREQRGRAQARADAPDRPRPG